MHLLYFAHYFRANIQHFFTINKVILKKSSICAYFFAFWRIFGEFINETITLHVRTRIIYRYKCVFRTLMNTNYSHDSTPSNNATKKARCFTCKSDFRQIKICLNPIISNAIFLRYHQNKPTSIHQQTLISSSKQRNNTPITPNDPSTPQISTNNPICTYKATTFYYKSAIFLKYQNKTF